MTTRPRKGSIYVYTNSIGGRPIDPANLADGTVIVYDAVNNKYYYVDLSNIYAPIVHTHAQYITEVTKSMIEAVLIGTITSHDHTGVYEPVISVKNTAFNKNFGTAAGTVAEGNHTHSEYITGITKAMVEAVLTGEITTHTHPVNYSLPLAANGTRGGLQIGYTATGANLPLLLSSEKGYVTLTNAAIVAGLGFTPYNATNPAGYTSNVGTVTSVSAGNGMSFTTITGAGSVVMGTPSSVTLSSTNAVAAGTHSHAFAPGGTTAQYITGAGTLVTFPTIPTVNNATLSLATSGIATGSQTFTANQSTNATFTVNVPGTNIAEGTRTTTTVPITSSTGTGATLSAATTSLAGVMTSADKTKLDGIAASANNYSLPLATNGTRGGIQIGYTATGANLPLLLSSEKAYITLTSGAITSGLGYTPYNSTNPSGYTSNTGTVTSVSAGNGMNFTTITGSGAVTMGTPSTLTGATTNNVTATSHTHAISLTASDVSALPISGGTMTGAITFAAGQTWPTFNQSTTGNAATATTLQTARTINGTSFNGSANITTANWGTSRNITIGSSTKSVNGSSDVSFTHAEMAVAYQLPINDARNNLGSPTVEEMALFHGQFNNKFRFIPAFLQEESTNGTVWTTSSRATADQLADIMLGEGQAGGFTAIPSGTIGTYGGYRLTWDASQTGYVFLNALYVYNSASGNTITATIEAYHNTNGWQTISGPHNFGNWPGHTYFPHTSIPFSTNASQYGKIRITFSSTHNAYTNGFTLYAIEWFGGYPAGRRNVEWYDRNQNVYFPNYITATLGFIKTGSSNSYFLTGGGGHLAVSDFAAASHGYHVPTPQTANNAVFLRNDNSWQTVTPANIGAAATNQTMYIGTTAVAINRASAALTLAGITLTTPNIGVATGTSFNSITGLASANPLVNGTVAVGTSTLVARQDHVHPTDTTRAATNQTMYIGTTAVAINRASAALTLTGVSLYTLTRGTGLTGSNYNGSAAQTWAVSYGTAAGTACQGNDSRLSDARTPTDNSVTYAKLNTTLTSRQAVAASAIDWSLGGVYTKTLTGTTTFTFSNLQLNKVITLVVSGNYTLNLPAYCKKISGTYAGTTTNYIQFHCTNATGGAEEVWYTISKQA